MEAQAAHVTADTLLSFTENKWQTQDSWMELLGWLDAKLNPAGEGRDWILVLDLASVHKAEAAVKATPKHIHLCFIPAGATSYLQPCDKALLRAGRAASPVLVPMLWQKRWCARDFQCPKPTILALPTCACSPWGGPGAPLPR